ncbi:MAG: VOC family protein [Thermoleophilia bacterium]
MKFAHVATRTKNLDTAIAFYGLLGMKLTEKIELTKNQATLAFIEPAEGNFGIELVYNWGRDKPYDGGERFGHFAFVVDDVDETYRRLVAAGAGALRAPALLQGVGPSKIAFISDPDDNQIELIQRNVA